MMKRSMGWILAGIACATPIPFVATGCGASLEGDCNASCQTNCMAGDDCEDYTHVLVDRQDCLDKCPDQCRSFADKINADCDRKVDIHQDNIERCINSIAQLGAACRNKKQSEITDAASTAATECSKKQYECN